MTAWHTADTAKAADGNLATVPLGTLTELVEVARDQVLAFAPALADDADLPVRYRVAQLMQVQALWKAQKVGPGDVIGPEGYTVRVFPMDWNIQAIIRPKTAGPRLG